MLMNYMLICYDKNGFYFVTGIIFDSEIRELSYLFKKFAVSPNTTIIIIKSGQ